MAYKALLGFFIHIESFRNINLSHQGAYYAKISVYSEAVNKEPIIKAYPLENYTSILAPKKAKSGNMNFELPLARINNEIGEFITKTFIIKYCEEDVELNDFCDFRADIEINQLQRQINFIMEIQLMYAELNLQTEEKQNISIKPEGFTLAATKKYRISNSISGISQYLPVIFDQSFYSILNCNIHTSLLDFRYRPLPNLLLVSSVEPEKNSKKKNNIDNKENIKTLSECLFEDDKGNVPKFLDLEITDKVYTCYCKAMSIAHENLIGRFKEYESKCITEKQISENQDLFDTPDLIFPGDDNEDEMFSIKNHTQTTGPIPSKGEMANNQNPPDDVNTSCNISQDTTLLINEKKNEEDKEEPEPSILEESSAQNEMDEKISGKSKLIPNFKNKSKIKITNTKVNQSHSLKSNTRDPNKVAAKFALNISLLGGQVIELWHRFIELNQISPKFIIELSSMDYFSKISQKWEEFIIKSTVIQENIAQIYDPKISESHLQESKSIKKKVIDSSAKILYIDDLTTIQNSENLPIIFEQNCVKKEKKSPENNKIVNENYIHLFVLVHGFQGNSMDMCILKNNLTLLFPESLILCSYENETKTEGDIFEMGSRLAKEVKQYITEWCPGNILGKITFIGHSLGGIIIRAALQNLEEYKEKMFTFMTLSSPHMGYLYNSSKIIDAGMWLLKKWKKGQALQQLTMEDSKSIENSLLYKLSESASLGWFKNIILIGSSQDSYVPIDSALIEISPKALGDKAKGQLYSDISKNIDTNVKAEKIYKLDVIFNICDKNLDSFIGRTAHIQFLENDYLMKILLYRFYELLV